MKVRRSQVADEDQTPYRLQITSKHAVGGAGGVLVDEQSYAALPDLLAALQDLQLPGELLATANATIELERAEDRWVGLLSDVQIPIDVLKSAGFELDDVSY